MQIVLQFDFIMQWKAVVLSDIQISFPFSQLFSRLPKIFGSPSLLLFLLCTDKQTKLKTTTAAKTKNVNFQQGVVICISSCCCNRCATFKPKNKNSSQSLPKLYCLAHVLLLFSFVVVLHNYSHNILEFCLHQFSFLLLILKAANKVF